MSITQRLRVGDAGMDLLRRIERDGCIPFVELRGGVKNPLLAELWGSRLVELRGEAVYLTQLGCEVLGSGGIIDYGRTVPA